jgi:hypothetical protein
MRNEQLRLISSPGSGIRASDADRERTSELLRRHHLEGRLDASEFQERLEWCLRAKTLGELRALSVDLPGEDSGQVWRAIPGLSRPAWWLAIAATVITALIVASALTERPLFFPAVPILFLWLRGFWWRGGWHRRSVLGGQDAGLLR